VSPGLAAFVFGTAMSCTTDDGGPRLDTVNPISAPRSAQVTITGRRLCGSTGDCAHAAGQVQLGLGGLPVQAVIVGYADTSAQIVIPSATPIGKTSIVATVDDHASNALDFEVLP